MLNDKDLSLSPSCHAHVRSSYDRIRSPCAQGTHAHDLMYNVKGHTATTEEHITLGTTREIRM